MLYVYVMCVRLVQGCYMTIHITPEPSCSYVSFESNVCLPPDALLARVLAAFRPNKFVVTVFATPVSWSTFIMNNSPRSTI